MHFFNNKAPFDRHCCSLSPHSNNNAKTMCCFTSVVSMVTAMSPHVLAIISKFCRHISLSKAAVTFTLWWCPSASYWFHICCVATMWWKCAVVCLVGEIPHAISLININEDACSCGNMEDCWTVEIGIFFPI